MTDDTAETCSDTSRCSCCGLVFAAHPDVEFVLMRDEEMLFAECVDRDACAERMPPGGWHS